MIKSNRISSVFTNEIKTNLNTLKNIEESIDVQDYDPYKHRTVKNPRSNFATLFYLSRGSLGAGILALPNAFKSSGYVTGTIGVIIIAIISTYCIHLLIQAEYELCKRNKIPSMLYPEIAEAAFYDGPACLRCVAPYIANIVKIFLIIYHLGACCVYVVFIAANIKSIADFYIGHTLDIRIYMLVILIPLISINCIGNLKYLEWFSVIGNIVSFISSFIISYYFFREPITTTDRKQFGSIKEFPLFVGTVLFALVAIGEIFSLESEMKTPKNFGGSFGVLNIAMTFIVSLYIKMGLFGYLKYGDEIQGSITLNLPANERLAQAGNGFLAFAIYITHALAMYVAIDITWNHYITNIFQIQSNIKLWEYCCRTALVLITFFLAVIIPNFELFISLFGAMCISTLGLALPGLIQIALYWNQRIENSKNWIIFFNLILVIIGILGFTIGTSSILAEIVQRFF